MSSPDAKAEPRELRIIYLNGSIVPLTGHELVAALVSRNAFVMMLVTVVLLSLPSGGGVFAEGAPWVRIVVNVSAVCVFVGLVPPLLFHALNRATAKGQGQVRLVTVTLPAAVLSTLSAESFGIILTGGSISRLALLSKLCLGVLFWEAVVFLGVWFYAPVLGRQSVPEVPAREDCPPMKISGLEVEPKDLRRIETDGRYLHIHMGEAVHTVSARMQDVAAMLEPHGVMVHRCHWVAYHALGLIAVKGRTYEMTTLHGEKVPVARNRRDALRDILAKATQP